jgi:hypothetical protein
MTQLKTAVAIGLTTAAVSVATIGRLASTELSVERPGAPADVSAPAPAATSSPVLQAIGPLDANRAKGPQRFKASERPQVLPVTGKNFAADLTATLVAPLGLSTTFPASALDDLTPTSFTLGVMMDEPGTYLFSVRSPSGARSNTIPIVVTR